MEYSETTITARRGLFQSLDKANRRDTRERLVCVIMGLKHTLIVNILEVPTLICQDM